MSRKKRILPYAVALGMIVIVLIITIKLTPNKTTEAAPQSKTFPEEKILTSSAEEYCKSTGKNLADFNLVGVHGEYLAKFFANLPINTEIVVSYNSEYNDNDAFFGTALVPKKSSQ